MLTLCLALAIHITGTASAGTSGGLRADAPVSHANLAVYLLRGAGAARPAGDFATLGEASKAGTVAFEEMGGGAQVNTLRIRNDGTKPLFLQAGEIVRGGRQDRTIVGSVVIPPKSGWNEIPAFCVEHGRWSYESGDKRFRSAGVNLPSKELKRAAIVEQNQQKVWDNVAAYNGKAAGNVGLATGALAPESPSSLAKSVENKDLTLAVEPYLAALAKADVGAHDVVGAAIAVNGRLVSADVFGSHELFAKRWSDLSRAAAYEAVSAKDSAEAESAPPAPAAAADLINATAMEKGEARPAPKGGKQTVRRGKKATAVEYADETGTIHTTYLAE